MFLSIFADDMCFVYSVVAALKHEECIKKRQDALSAKSKVYRDFVAQLDLSDVTFPMDNESIEKFLRKNRNLLNVVVHIYCIFDSKVYPCVLNLGANIKTNTDEPKTMVALLSVDVKPTKESLFAASHILAIRNLDG